MRLKLDVYERLLRINAGFEQVLRSLAALERQRRFDAGELKRFRLRSRETQAALNSFLAATIESAESDAAGSLLPAAPGARKGATKNAFRSPDKALPLSSFTRRQSFLQCHPALHLGD